MDNGSTQVLNSVVRPTASVFTEPHQTSSVPINLPSPGRLTSIGSQFSLNEPNHSFDEMKASSPHIGFHPHSLPEYGGNIAHGGSYKSASTILDMASNVGPKITEGLHGFSSNGHLMEPNGGGKLIDYDFLISAFSFLCIIIFSLVLIGELPSYCCMF